MPFITFHLAKPKVRPHGTPTLQPLAPTIHFLPLRFLPLSVPDVSRIRQDLFFRVWLISRSAAAPGVIHVVVRVRISFLFQAECSRGWTHWVFATSSGLLNYSCVKTKKRPRAHSSVSIHVSLVLRYAVVRARGFLLGANSRGRHLGQGGALLKPRLPGAPPARHTLLPSTKLLASGFRGGGSSIHPRCVVLRVRLRTLV